MDYTTFWRESQSARGEPESALLSQAGGCQKREDGQQDFAIRVSRLMEQVGEHCLFIAAECPLGARMPLGHARDLG